MATEKSIDTLQNSDIEDKDRFDQRIGRSLCQRRTEF